MAAVQERARSTGYSGRTSSASPYARGSRTGRWDARSRQREDAVTPLALLYREERKFDVEQNLACVAFM